MFIQGLLALTLAGVVPRTTASAPAGPWDTFNFAPASKTVYPVAIRRTEGNVSSSEMLINNNGEALLNGNDSWVTLDYGKEVRTLTLLRSTTMK